MCCAQRAKTQPHPNKMSCDAVHLLIIHGCEAACDVCDISNNELHDL